MEFYCNYSSINGVECTIFEGRFLRVGSVNSDNGQNTVGSYSNSYPTRN
jgi:hypothetical protein